MLADVPGVQAGLRTVDAVEDISSPATRCPIAACEIRDVHFENCPHTDP